MINLTEAIKTKPEKLALQNTDQLELVTRLRHSKLSKLNKVGDGIVLYDYLDSSIKRRAQTIGLAFTIAFKIMIELFLNKDTIKKTFLDSFHFKLSNTLKETVDLEDEYVSLFVNTLKELLAYEEMGIQHYNGIKVDVDRIEFVKCLACSSVTLAWLYAKEKSGFLPGDKTIMLKGSPTQELLRAEVALLIEKSLITIENICNQNIDKVYIDPEIYDVKLGFVASIDLIINEVAIDITTASKIKDSSSPQLLCFNAINNKVKAYDIDRLDMLYIRSNTVISFNPEEEDINA